MEHQPRDEDVGIAYELHFFLRRAPARASSASL